MSLLKPEQFWIFKVSKFNKKLQYGTISQRTLKRKLIIRLGAYYNTSLKVDSYNKANLLS